MDITPDIRAIIDGLPGPTTAAAAPEGGGFGRVAQNLANMPSRFLEQTGSGLLGLLQMGNPGPADTVSVPKFFDIPEAKTMGDVAGDFFVGEHGLGDVMAQILAPAGALGKVGRMAGAKPGKMLDFARFMGGEAFAEAGLPETDGLDVAVAGAVGGMQAPLSYLPMSKRLPASALLAGLHGGYETMQRGGLAGGITAGADFLGVLVGLPGGAGGKTPLQAPELPPVRGPLSTWFDPSVPVIRPTRIGRMTGNFEMYGKPYAATDDIIYAGDFPALHGRTLALPSSPDAKFRLARELGYTYGPHTGPVQPLMANLPTPAQQTRSFQYPEIFATLQKQNDPRVQWPMNRGPSTAKALNPIPNVPVETPVIPRGKLKPQSGPEYWRSTYDDTALSQVEADLVELDVALKKATEANDIKEVKYLSDIRQGTMWAIRDKRKAEIDRLRNARKATKPTPEQKIKWSPEEQAYSKTLAKGYNNLNEAEIREMILDIDNDIANSGDEGSIRSYRLARETAENVLNSRKVVEPEPVAPKTAAAFKIKRGMAVAYRDEMGGMERATVTGFDKATGTVKIKFEGTGQEVTVPKSRLSDKVPEKIATLQNKPDFDDVESLSIKQQMEEVDDQFQMVGEDVLRKREEQVPGKVRENQEPEDLHGGRFAQSGTGTGPDSGPKIKIDFGTTLETSLKAKLQSVILEVLRRTNRNVDVRFVDDLKGRKIAVNTTFGNIEMSEAKIAKWFKDWPKMSDIQKSRVMMRFSQLVGHEVGHSALIWARVHEPKLYKELVKEFKNLSEESRLKILDKFYKLVGREGADNNIEYFAGTDRGILRGYKMLHPDMSDEIAEFGMEEFFGEMFSARVMGLLNEEFLPKEMANFWQKLKDVFRKFFALFNPASYLDQMDSMDEQISFQSFTEMMENISEGFRKADGAQYWQTMGKGSAMRDMEFTAAYHKGKKYKDAEADQVAMRQRDAALKKKNKGKVELIPDPDYDLTNPDYAARGFMGGAAMKAAFGRELTQELGSGLAGAIVGGIIGPQLTDGQLAMSEGILMGGVMGALGPRAIKALLAVPKSTSGTFHHKTFAQALADVFKGKSEAVAGDAATGHGSSVAKFMRFLERNMNMHLPPELFNAVVDADGAAAWALHTVDDAFKKARHYKGPAAFDAATQNYLSGNIDLRAYRSVLTGLGRDAERGGNFYIAAREAIATLQTHFAVGLPNGTLKAKILKSITDGDYLTRQYRIFHDPKYRPTQTQVEAVAFKYASDHPTVSLDAARSIIENYIHEIKTAGTDYRGSVTDVGKKLDAYLWEKRDLLDPAFRDMLGEYHDPREKVLGTIQHLYTSAITGKLINTITNLKDKMGLNFSYGIDEHSRVIDQLKAQILHGAPPAGKTIATLQKELEVLKAYVPLDTNRRYGKLAGTMVSRFVRDQLATFDSPWGMLDGTLMRSLAKFHNYVKIARAPLNPITVVRNIIAMPILSALGGAIPLVDNLRAFRLIKRGGPEVREMLEQGILNVDAIRGEMLRNVDYVRMLGIDDSITGLVQKGINKALDFYRWPDMLVRGATYMRAKTKFSKELGLPESHADVIAKARDWTNRYTVNYANVAPIVKTLRQIPFTNLFISYTAEITRITKNLVQDVFSHEDPGQRVRAAGLIGGLAATPFVLEKFATLQLSEKDRKEWNKARALMPDYQRTKHLIVMGREKDGRFRYFDMTPLVQIDALTQMGRAIVAGDTAALAAVNPVVSWENTPAVNIVAEQITGEDLRSGRPIDKNILTRAKAVLDDVVPPILPGGYEFRRWSEALSRTDTGDLGTTNARTGRRTTPGEIVSSYLTGMRFGTVDANKLHQFAVADAKRKIANEQAYLRDVVQTNVVQRQKEKALKRYQEAQKQILLELTQRLQPD